MYPTPWQKKILWGTLTALAIGTIVLLAVVALLGLGAVLRFFQLVLLPVAAAGIVAFLLQPLVDRFVAWGLGHGTAVWAVFGVVLLPLVLLGFLILPEIYRQSVDFAVKLPGYFTEIQTFVTEQARRVEAWFEVRGGAESPYLASVIEWGHKVLPTLPMKVWAYVTGGVQGFLGVAGFLLGMMLVPLYLYYFLMNAASISARWGDYLPLRASPFKQEVMECLMEINHYLVAFFRGQIIVALIDGILIGVSLLVMGLNFALLIGLMTAVLQLIPYLGAIVCWILSVVIAYAQFHDWQHPLYVTLIFLVVLQLEGFFISPKIVGDATGLHPMTIIVSVFAWSLLIGGLLGALLAVPLTATLKVLLRRYVWQRRASSS